MLAYEQFISVQTIFQTKGDKLMYKKLSGLAETCGALNEIHPLLISLYNWIDLSVGSGHIGSGRNTISYPSCADIWSIMSKAECGGVKLHLVVYLRAGRSFGSGQKLTKTRWKDRGVYKWVALTLGGDRTRGISPPARA